MAGIKRARAEENSDESEEERRIPVPLKRRQYLDMIPPTKDTDLDDKTSFDGILAQFEVLSNPFRHHYSDLPDGHIRILVIKKAGNVDEPLQLELHPEPLDCPSESYEALSYEWGTNFPRYSLAVRDSTMSIGERFQSIRDSQDSPRVKARNKFRLLVRTICYKRTQTHNITHWIPKRLVRQNLHNALLQFRRKKKDVRLWIDAICINQYNVVEKTDQITKMAEIYNKARHVRIWLGVKHQDTDLAVDFIKELADFERLSAILKHEDVARKWHALTSLMRNRWFSRRWVIQEQGVARKASLYWGNAKVDWTDFADAVSIFRTKRHSILKELSEPPLGSEAIIQVFDGLGATTMVRQNTQLLHKDLEGKLLEKTRTLEELVTEFTPFMASDPRDTIYAVMSIARTQGPAFDAIRPDYQKSLLQVYVDFVRFCVLSSGSLDIICRHWAPVETTLKALAPEVNAAGNPVKNYVKVKTTLPSWIKQLDESTFGRPDSVLQGRKQGDVLATLKPLYHASRGFMQSDVKYEFGTKDASNTDSTNGMGIGLKETWDGTLTVRGIILGEVKCVSQRISEGTIPREVFKMGGWQHSRQPDDHTVHEMPDQLWRTLVANQGFDGQQPPSYFRRSCLYALQREDQHGDVNIKALVDHEQTPEVVSTYLRKVQDIVRNRKAFLAGENKELFGFGSERIRGQHNTGEKDHVCIIYGCSVPVVLRRVQGNPPKIGLRMPEPRAARFAGQPSRRSLYNHRSTTSQSSPEPAPTSAEAGVGEYWKLIGECYVDGRMDGEAIYNQEYLENERDFVLI